MKALGISKHRKSGRTTKSPKARHRAMLDAKNNDRKASEPTCKHKTVRECK